MANSTFSPTTTEAQRIEILSEVMEDIRIEEQKQIPKSIQEDTILLGLLANGLRISIEDVIDGIEAGHVPIFNYQINKYFFDKEKRDSKEILKEIYSLWKGTRGELFSVLSGLLFIIRGNGLRTTKDLEEYLNKVLKDGMKKLSEKQTPFT